VLSPDPAVFEAAFVIDDSEESRVGTPMPEMKEKAEGADAVGQEKPKTNVAAAAGQDQELMSREDGDRKEDITEKSSEPAPAAPSKDLPSDVRAKLKKLEKLEATYPGKHHTAKSLDSNAYLPQSSFAPTG
jgi:hypothetical protein